jgi:hypothetical protein
MKDTPFDNKEPCTICGKEKYDYIDFSKNYIDLILRVCLDCIWEKFKDYKKRKEEKSNIIQKELF